MAEQKKMNSGAAVVDREEEERLNEERIRQYQEEAKERVEAIRESRVLTDKDLQILINTRD